MLMESQMFCGLTKLLWCRHGWTCVSGAVLAAVAVGCVQCLHEPPGLSLQSVLDEMMVEQTDLVRLRMVRMSNVPDTLYMVNNAVPQCCHVITHQQVSTNQTSPPSVIANEIPGELLMASRAAISWECVGAWTWGE